MKPLNLKFSGLNSYRESQVVDFEELGRGGLFGIFGPTGSGKSSILDAITLALYGKVDRAVYDTRGIINQREKYVDVSFSFELGGTRYTVQRRYERSGSDPEGVKAKSATLVRADGAVLADRSETVTKKVEELIGLTFSEFCRAVVLPQGKFDQFLRLTGAARAEMLGHIFELDRFGDRLYNAAVKRRDQSQAKLDSIEMSKKELGDCSDAAIAQAQVDLNEKKIELDQAESEYSKVQSSYDEAKKLRELHSQLQSAELRKKDLDNLKPEIDRDLELLNAARRAEPLRDLIDTVNRLSGDKSKFENDLDAANAGLQKVQADLCDAEERTKRARERKDREESLLTEKKTRLQAALDMEQELNGLRKRKVEVSEKLTELERLIHDQQTYAKKKEDDLRRLEDEVRSLESKQKELLVDPVQRARLDEAVKKLTLLENGEDELKSRRDELKAKGESTENARSAALATYGQLAKISASRYFFDESGELRIRDFEIPGMEQASCGAEILAVAEKETELARDLSEKADEVVRQAMIHDQAVLLARELEDGRPCPVCGSLHHPNVASGSPEKYQRAQEARKLIKQCEKALQAWYKKLQAAANQWDSCRQNEEEVEGKCKLSESGVKQALEDFLNAARGVLGDSYCKDTARDAVNRFRAEILLKDNKYAAVSQELDAARAKEGGLRDEVERGREVLAKLESDRNSSERELRLLGEQVSSSEAKLSEMTGGEDPSKAIREVESAIRSLKDELNQAEKAEDELRKKVEVFKQRVSGLKASLDRISEELRRQSDVLAARLSDAGFRTPNEAEAAILPRATMEALEKRINDYREERVRVESEISRLEKEIGSRVFCEEDFQRLEAQLSRLESDTKRLREEHAAAKANLEVLKQKREKWDELERARVTEEKKRDLAAKLASLVRGKALVTFLAEEYLKDIAADASARLGSLTRQRYALEISDGSNFVIRDDFNGGERRSVGTLSGGEMFLTSLSLALALSSRIQLRGQYPLGFFFLDEGFGTLDEEKLDVVITALEKLHDKDRMVGVISHVKELKERLAYYLEVIPAKDDGTGSRVVMRRR
ncbi:MAG TPA: SMC family ATPase [Firmicutes bacterium]|nr:SMC family ATPase [Candidatus Fermentithermobacillaceae bacterium]